MVFPPSVPEISRLISTVNSVFVRSPYSVATSSEIGNVQTNDLSRPGASIHKKFSARVRLSVTSGKAGGLGEREPLKAVCLLS